MVDDIAAAGPGGDPGWCGTSSPGEGRGKGANVGGVVCAGCGCVGGGAPAWHRAATSFRVAQGGAQRVLSLPADEAPLFVPVVTELRGAGPGAQAAAWSSTAISIKIGGAWFARRSGSTRHGC